MLVKTLCCRVDRLPRRPNISAKDNRDVPAHSTKVTMPVRYVLVCDTRSDVEHDDSTLSLNIIAVTKTTELLLTSGIPDIEADCAEVDGKSRDDR